MNTLIGICFLLLCMGLVVLIVSHKLNKSKQSTDGKSSPTPAKKGLDPEKLGGFVGVAIVAGTILAVPFAGISCLLYCSPHHNRSCPAASVRSQRQQDQQQRPTEQLKRYSKVRVTQEGGEWLIKMPPPGDCLGTLFNQIRVKRGDRVEIKASGRFRWHSRKGAIGPGGDSRSPRQFASNPLSYPLPDSRGGSLLVRIGEHNLSVGKYTVITSPDSAPLIFKLNDERGRCSDQEGWLDIRVFVSPQTSKQPRQVEVVAARKRR